MSWPQQDERLTLKEAVDCLRAHSADWNERRRILSEHWSDDEKGAAFDCIIAYIDEVASDRDLNEVWGD